MKKYYRVKPLNPAFMELVEVSKKKIYWFFGARFESMEV
jgi:hypothetical protein